MSRKPPLAPITKASKMPNFSETDEYGIKVYIEKAVLGEGT